jgi:hypothetical protein
VLENNEMMSKKTKNPSKLFQYNYFGHIKQEEKSFGNQKYESIKEIE